MLKPMASISVMVAILLGGMAEANAQNDDAVLRLQMPSVFFVDEADTPEEMAATAAALPGSSSQIGGFFTTQLSAAGGTPPYVFEFSGQPPSGWTISGSTLAGTYSSLGVLAFSVIANDSAAPPQTKSIPFTTSVVDEFPLTASFEAVQFQVGATVDRPAPAVTGNDGPVSFALHSGSLPPGVTLAGNGTMSGSITGVADTSGTAIIRVSDSYSNLDIAFPWSISAPTAASTVPVVASFKFNASSWNEIGDHAALRNGNLSTPAVNMMLGHLVLDLGASVEGNSILVAANYDFTYRVISSETPTTGFTSWGPTNSYTGGSGIKTLGMGASRSHRYVGIQILSAQGPSGTVGITELRYGKDDVYP